jgi:hypothetical protein
MCEVIDLAPWLAEAHETIKEKRRPRDKSTVALRLGSKSGLAPKPAPTPRAPVPCAAAAAPEPAFADHRRRSGQTAAARAIPDRELSQAIRAWGRANGHKVAAHGFLSPELVEAYHAAHQREARRQASRDGR